MRRQLGWFAGVGLGLMLGCSAPVEQPEAVAEAALELTLPAGSDAAAAAMDVDAMHALIAELSSDEMLGRGPSTDGDRESRKAIAAALERAGCEPGAADGSWEQKFGLIGLTSSMPERWRITSADGSIELDWWDEYVGTSGVQQATTTIDNAGFVFVGYGIEAPEENWDDYKGADVSGKILVMLNNDPDWDPDMFAGTRRLYYGRWTYKYESAARHGAAGAIVIHTEPSAGYPWAVVQAGWSGQQFELPAGDEARTQFTGWVTEDAARSLMQLAGMDLDQLVESARSRDFRPVDLPLTSSLTFSTEMDRSSESANVLGLIRGRDPELNDELVVYTAHHDHLGVGDLADRPGLRLDCRHDEDVVHVNRAGGSRRSGTAPGRRGPGAAAAPSRP